MCLMSPSRDHTALFTAVTNGRQGVEEVVPSPDQSSRAPITRETRDRILRIIKDRTGASDAPSTTDEFV